MIYEAEVTFHSLSDIKFVRKQDAKDIVLNQPSQLFVQINRHMVTFMDEDQNPFASILAEHLFVSEHKKLHTELTVESKHGGVRRPVATFKASHHCIKEIYDLMFKNKKYKSCLAFIPSKVQHISILSGGSPTQRYRGFINLAAIMFLVLNLRNIIDNFYHYGVQFKRTPGDFIPLHTLVATASLSVFVIYAFLLEKMKFNRVISYNTAKFFITINWMLALILNLLYCHRYFPAPVPAIFFTTLAVIITLKLISFQQVNSELYSIIDRLRVNKKKGEGKKIDADLFTQYEISPENLQLIRDHEGHWQSIVNFPKLVYFIFAPTLCYQLQYPRSSSIRQVWLAKRIVEFIVVIGFQTILWFQYIEPELKSMFKTLHNPEATWLEIINRHLRLSVPNTIAWIAGFYGVFHLWFNILGEVLYFGDRNFYKDWWNCRSIEEYWKTWNLPVHFWFLRHIYNPLLQHGYSKTTAGIVVFFISAVAHEYLVSVPLGVFSYVAFLGMLMQAPAIIIQKKIDKLLRLENSELGNASFWVFFCFVGQPLMVSIYYSIYASSHPEILQ